MVLSLDVRLLDDRVSMQRQSEIVVTAVKIFEVIRSIAHMSRDKIRLPGKGHCAPFHCL